MAKIIQFPIIKTPEERLQETVDRMKAERNANKMFDYTELQNRIFDRYDIETFAAALGKTADGVWDCIHETHDTFSLPDIDCMIALLDIPDCEISRVFFTPYAV